MREIFICDYIRTPIGRYGGALSSIRTDDLAALPLKALMESNRSADWSAIDDVILGCANQAGEDNRNVARMALLLGSRLGASHHPQEVLLGRVLAGQFTVLLRDPGLLEAALFRPQTGYYDDLIQEAAALWESLSQNHPFVDGNKRTAFAVTYTFLVINGATIAASCAETEAFVLGLYAAGNFDFRHLEQWLRTNVRGGGPAA